MIPSSRLVPALVLVFLIPLPGAGATGISASVGVDVLRGVSWMDDGEVRVGVDGTGVPILVNEGFNRQLPSMADCYTPGRYVQSLVRDYTGTGILINDTPRNDWLHGHGTMVISVLCATQPEWAAADLAGLARGAPVYSYDGSSDPQGTSEWFKDDPPRVFTSSLLRSSMADEVRNMGGDPDQVVLVAAMGNSRAPIASDSPLLDPRVMRVAGAFADGSDMWALSTHGQPGRPQTYPSLVAPACVWVVDDPTGQMSVPPGSSTVPYTLISSMGGLARGKCPPVDMTAWVSGYPLDPRGQAGGTSLAAPAVAAAAALVLQVNPDLSPAEVRHVLEQSSDNFLPTEDTDGDGVVSKQEFYDQHGWQAGWGFLNASKAVATSHYLRMHSGASLDEALACSTIEEVGGALWLNPGPRCDRGASDGEATPPLPPPGSPNGTAQPDDATDRAARGIPFAALPLWLGFLAVGVAVTRKLRSQ